MSFDPHNPRGAPAPPPSQPPRYVPPQPVRSGPSRTLIAAAVVIVIVLFALGGLVVLNLVNKPHSPATTPPSSAASMPTTTAQASTPPTTGASGLPTTPGPATPGPTFVVVAPSPGTPEAELLSHIPPALQATCTEMTAASSPPIYMAQCSASADQITINYTRYDSADAMNATYQEQFAAVQIDANSGSCDDHTTWPAESSYDIGGVPAGRRLCTDQQGVPTVIWTDERLNILASVRAAQASDAAALVQFWMTQAGPIQ